MVSCFAFEHSECHCSLALNREIPRLGSKLASDMNWLLRHLRVRARERVDAWSLTVEEGHMEGEVEMNLLAIQEVMEVGILSSLHVGGSKAFL